MTKNSLQSPMVEEMHGCKILKDCQTSSGLCISTGDFVHLIPADPCIEKYVGKVESIYQDGSALKRIQVRWFYRSQDLQHEPPTQPLENEVYHTSYYDCQLVDSVVGRCVIMHTPEYSSRDTRNPNMQDALDVYTCGYSYSLEMGQFVAIQKEDLAGSASKLPSINGKHIGDAKYSHEDTVAARKLANALLGVDRIVPRDVARADWSTAKRLPWVLRAKNAMTLEDVKQLLIDLESGLDIFKHQRGWRKSVQAINTFDAHELQLQLHTHIQYLQQSTQQKVDEAFKKLRRVHLDHQTRKRKPAGMPRLKENKWRETERDCTTDKEGGFQKVISSGRCFGVDRLHVMGAASKGRHDKLLMEEPMDDLWKSVEVMQDDVALVLDSMGFSQAMVPVQSCDLVPTNNLLALTDRVEDGSPTGCVAESASKENILLFQMAAKGASCQGLPSDYIAKNEVSTPLSNGRAAANMEAVSLSCFSVEKQTLSSKEEQQGCGFRVWKPEGSLASSSSARNMAFFQTEANKQINICRPVLV